MEILIFFINHKIIRYIFSGGMATITNILILFLLTDIIGINYIISGIVSFSISVVVSFTLQKFLTFQDNSTDNLHKKFIIFIIIAVINLIANTSLLYVFTEYFGLYYILSQIFAGAIVAFWSFFLYKIIVFKS